MARQGDQPILGSLVALLSWYARFCLRHSGLPVAAAVWFGLQNPIPVEGQSWSQYFATLGQIIKQKGVSLLVAFLIGFGFIYPFWLFLTSQISSSRLT